MLGDVVIPEDPVDVVTPIDGVYDQPSTIQDGRAKTSAAASATAASAAFIDVVSTAELLSTVGCGPQALTTPTR